MVPFSALEKDLKDGKEKKILSLGQHGNVDPNIACASALVRNLSPENLEKVMEIITHLMKNKEEKHESGDF